MKSNYLADLSKLLDDYQIDKLEKQEIIDDYSEMYDGWIEKGYLEDEVEKKLGHPRSIIKDLTEGYSKVERPLPGSEKAIALSPFIATIAFFILGFGYNLWHPGWLVYLIIPVVGIVVSMGKTKEEHMSTALSPFVATVIFFLLGYLYDLWHPAWLVFLIVPLLGIWNSRYTMKKSETLVSLSPFIALITYIILGTIYGYWAEGWLVFLIIPMLGILNHPNILIVFLWESLAIVGIAGYLYIGHTLDSSWYFPLVAFIPFVIFSMFRAEFEVSGNMSKRYLLVVLVSLGAFLAVGYFLSLWQVSWLFILLIPVYAILSEVDEKEKAVAVSPFVALTLFILIGYFFDVWHLSWMAFLLIPMTAIVKNA